MVDDPKNRDELVNYFAHIARRTVVITGVIGSSVGMAQARELDQVGAEFLKIASKLRTTSCLSEKEASFKNALSAIGANEDDLVEIGNTLKHAAADVRGILKTDSIEQRARRSVLSAIEGMKERMTLAATGQSSMEKVGAPLPLFAESDRFAYASAVTEVALHPMPKASDGGKYPSAKSPLNCR